jgi:hypothetical protein
LCLSAYVSEIEIYSECSTQCLMGSKKNLVILQKSDTKSLSACTGMSIVVGCGWFWLKNLSQKERVNC